MTSDTVSKASIGGLGAVAPMVAGRQRAGFTRRGLKPWLTKASVARPLQHKRLGCGSSTTDAVNASKGAQS